MHGRHGNVLLTNGSGDDVVADAVNGTVERWRVVNTANARTMKLSISGASWRVVGTDGGVLDAGFETEVLEVPVGQRYDLEVRYDNPGDVSLLSHVLTLDDANEVVEIQIPVFTVNVADSDDSAEWADWAPRPPTASREVDRTETLVFDGRQGGAYGIEWTLNGQATPDEPLFTFQQGQTVRMTLENRQGPEHPFHLHGNFFRIVQKFPVGPGQPQPGLRDTVLVPGRSTVEIIAYMDNPGRWMAHCHILAHAELGMMAEIVVEPSE
jgi:FtsP/CotA-like multicopper oxidase with cupredoxin domain